MRKDEKSKMRIKRGRKTKRMMRMRIRRTRKKTNAFHRACAANQELTSALRDEKSTRKLTMIRRQREKKTETKKGDEKQNEDDGCYGKEMLMQIVR